MCRQARHAAGLTQAQLAAKLGTTQSAVARLEADESNPSIATLARAVDACGQELVLAIEKHTSPSVDDSLVAGRLRLTPAERIKSFDRNYANLRELARAGAAARGELA